MRKIIIVLAGIVISMGLGALLALLQCSRRQWCPRYLRRQLNAWHRQVAKQNDERHRRKTSKPEAETPPDEAA